jgi:hypothetical protein
MPTQQRKHRRPANRLDRALPGVWHERARYLRERCEAGVILLSGGPEAPAEAREGLSAWGASLPSSTRAQAELLLTELVTNAVRHGGAHSR